MAKTKKFGTFSGVFTPSILTILGVIMYLRFPAILGQAGLINTIGIIVIAHIISITTGLSVASLSTDKPVQNGGTYFMISRSLGLPIGGTLGIALFIGLSFSVSLYLIGFAESFLQYFEIESNIQTIRLTGSIVLFIVTTITFISTSLAIKSQYFIMAAIVLSLISIFLGFGKHDFVSTEINWAPLATTAPFMLLFGIFFPAVTGFEAGVSMSGDLKNPKKSLPYGAMLAVGVGFIVYLILGFFFAYSVDAEALANDPQILFKIALSPTLVIAGIWGATLSSALGSILGAPRILQAISQDKIGPKFFAKGTGKSNEPRNALLLAFVIAEAGILIGELDVIARIVSMFFITTYAFLNLAAAIESWSSSDYRPAFRIPKFVSIIGAISAFLVMILLDFLALAGAVVALGLLFFYLRRKTLILESGDAWSSFWTTLAKKSLLKLTQEKANTRNWRPNILLFSGNQDARPHLVEMGLSLTGKLGALTDFNLIVSEKQKTVLKKQEIPKSELQKHNHFIREFHCDTLLNGIKSVSSVYGFSGFEPNTVLMGWSRDVQNADFLVDIIKDLTSKNLNAVFLDYDKNNGFGKKEKIDIWWDGKGRFLDFALNILKFLSSDSSWRDVEVRILVINHKTSMHDSIIRNTYAILDDKRQSAEVKVLNDDFGSRKIEEIINSESNEADLIVLGITQTRSKCTPEYINYINRLSDLPSSLLLLSPSNEFEEISLFEHEHLKVQDQPHEVAIELSNLPTIENVIIANRIESLDADIQGFGNTFNEKCAGKIFKTLHSIQLELKGHIVQNKDLLVKEIKDNGRYNFSKTITRNHQIFLRRIANQIEQRQKALLQELKDDLKNSLPEFLSSISNYIYKAPDTLTIPYVDDREKDKNLNFKYKKFINHYFEVFLNTELKEQLKSFEDITINQMVSLRELLFSISDSYEKLEILKEENIEETLKGLQEQVSRFEILENKLLEHNTKSNNNLLEALRNISISMASDMSNIADIKAANKKIKVKLESQSEYFALYPEYYGDGIMLLNNTMMLDAFLLSSKNLISNIVKGGNKKIDNIISLKLLEPLDAFIENTNKGLENSEKEFKPLQLQDKLEISGVFSETWDKVLDIIDDFLEDIEIPETVYQDDTFTAFSEYNAIHANLKKSSTFYIDTLFYEPYYRELQQLDKSIKTSIIELKEAYRLVIFHVNNQKDNNQTGLPITFSEKDFYLKLLKQISALKYKINEAVKRFDHFSIVYLKDAFSKLFYHSIAISEGKIRAERREQTGKKLTIRISENINKVKEYFSNLIIYLINSSSSGMLKSRKYLNAKEKGFIQSSEILEHVHSLLPNLKSYNTIPVFYRNLMNSHAKINEEFWVARDIETAKFKAAFQKHKRGFGGAIMFTGVHGAGKTTISRYVVNHHFNKKKVFWIEPPLGGSTQIDDFTKVVKEATNLDNDLPSIFNNMGYETCVVLNNLELWWERRKDGDIVLNKIIELIQTYGNKILFITTCNIHSLNIIKKVVQIEDNCLSIIECEPFNGNELKQLILKRHQSSGIDFNYREYTEDSVSPLALSMLFNRYFNVTKGIPGVALNTWKVNISGFKDDAILIKKPQNIKQEILSNMQPEWLIILAMFIHHKHMDREKIARISGFTKEKVDVLTLNLKNAGLLVDKNETILMLGRIAEPLIVETCLAKGII